ncbi:hypothetical protein IGI39_002640 [Enterococcus sp. AZ135]|uniref:hypothetical protein n=1 Tax=unclassified Enterococcus TaxID=2608891 RepID=UPI003F280033
MAKKYDEHPLGKLSDEALDQILEHYSNSYSAENKENILQKTRLKKTEPVVLATFSKRKLVMIAVLVLLFLPVGTYVAAKLWEITVEKQNYQLTTKIDKPAPQQPDTGNYRLVADYVPKYFKVYDDPIEFSFYEDIAVSSENEEALEALENVRGITFTLYELNKNDTVIDDYVKDYKEIKLSKGSAYIFEKVDSFDQIDAVVGRKFFEKQNKFVELKCYGNISEKEITKILDQLSLVNVATKEEATMSFDYLTPEDEAERIGTVDPMTLDSNNKDQVVQLNEGISTIDINGAPMEEITVSKVTLNNRIAPKYLSILKKRMKVGTYEEQDFGEKWDKNGKLQPITATEYTRGDGKNTTDREIREFKIQPKYLEIELKVKNVQDKTRNYSPILLQVEQLAKQGNIITTLPTETFLIHKDLSDPFNPYRYIESPAHPLPTTVDKIVDDLVVEDPEEMRSIAPGETGTFTVGYIFARENYNNLFLNINAYSPGYRYIQLTP